MKEAEVKLGDMIGLRLIEKNCYHELEFRIKKQKAIVIITNDIVRQFPFKALILRVFFVRFLKTFLNVLRLNDQRIAGSIKKYY